MEPLADAGFSAHCATLPAARYEVGAIPLSYTTDHSKSIDELSAKSGNYSETVLTMGLTTAKFGYQGDIELTVSEDAANREACGTLRLKVTLSMQPVAVYLARELASSRCAEAVTMQHELKHVAVFRELLDEARRDLQADLPSAMASSLRYGNSREQLERRSKDEVDRYLSEFIRRWQASLDERQAAVDSDAEHARLRNACPSPG